MKNGTTIRPITFENGKTSEDTLISNMGKNDQVSIWFEPATCKCYLKSNTLLNINVSLEYYTGVSRAFILEPTITEYIDQENPTIDSQKLAVWSAYLTFSTTEGCVFNYNNVCQYNSNVSWNTIMLSYDNIMPDDGSR